jgi:hypothetical protein
LNSISRIAGLNASARSFSMPSAAAPSIRAKTASEPRAFGTCTTSP